MIYYLHREQLIPAPLERVWAYFATPRNLNEMTPPDMAFEFVHGGDEPMYAGQVIEYRVMIVPGLRVRWLTQITHVRPGELFIDEQRIGPYRLWIHEHRFRPVADGVHMTDHVTYALPFGPLGDLVHALFVRRRLEEIFDFRRRKVIELFGPPPSKPGTSGLAANRSSAYAPQLTANMAERDGWREAPGNTRNETRGRYSP
jgi:ligand-binding SRPBCC domain-containing protein